MFLYFKHYGTKPESLNSFWELSPMQALQIMWVPLVFSCGILWNSALAVGSSDEASRLRWNGICCSSYFLSGRITSVYEMRASFFCAYTFNPLNKEHVPLVM
jgi:hypothetical protein